MKSLVKGVAINVGVNTNPEWGGFRGPIFSDGSFEFIHIPWKRKYGMIEPRPKKYCEMPYSRYIPDSLKNEYVLVSPDFCNCTYASTTDAPANKPILGLKKNDTLLFYATFDFSNERGVRDGWINPRWGAYIVGFFKIDFILESFRHVLASEVAREAFKEYTWFKSLLKLGVRDDWAPWIKGIKEESGLLKKAIPLSRPEDPQKWSDLAFDLFRTSRGKKLNTNKKAVFQTVLTCDGESLDELLAKCILRKCSK